MLEVQPHCKGEEKGLASNLLTLRNNLWNNERFTEIYLTHISTGTLTSTYWSRHIQTNERTENNGNNGNEAAYVALMLKV